MQSLFPQFSGSFSGGGSGRNELVSFNAGKMTATSLPTGKFLIKPDLKKGKVCLSRGDDQLLHFQWTDRTTGATPDDFIIFPDDATFSKVDTGREGDRVYILQYKGSSRRFFFWMQNKDSSRDEELSKKMNDLMNNATQGASSSGEGRSSTGGNVQLDHNAIMQMLGAMGAPGEGSRNGSGNSVQMADLQNILQNMGLPAQSAGSSTTTSSQGSAGNSSAAATTASTQEGAMDVDEMTEEELLRLAIEESMRDQGGNAETPAASATTSTGPTPATPVAPIPQLATAVAPVTASTGGITTADLQRAMASFQAMAAPKSISLSKLLSSSNIGALISNPEFEQRLLQHLPEGHQNSYELQETLHSPQFRQGISSLVSALQSGNFNAVLANFGLDSAAGASKLAFGDIVGAFLDAIQEWANRQDTNMTDVEQ